MKGMLMISALRPNINPPAALRQTSSATGARPFGALVSQSAKAATAPNSPFNGSTAAQATPSNTFDFDFSVEKLNQPRSEVAAYYAAGADRVSAMQGLPAGQYDFSNMTSAQYRVVMGHLGFSGKLDLKDMMGFPVDVPLGSMDANGKYVPPTEADFAAHLSSSQPQNWLAQTQARLSYDTSMGNSHATYFEQRAIDIMTQLSKSPAKPDLPARPDWAA